MSELMSGCNGGANFRRRLLATVSALPLLALVCGAGASQAADQDTDRPTLWIELGGQLEQQTGQGDSFAPPFVTNYLSSPAYKPASPLQSEKPPLFSNGAQAKITFEPDGSDWVFSAGILYGRANGDPKVKNLGPTVQHHTLFAGTSNGSQIPILFPPFSVTPSNVDFSDTRAKQHQSHAIVDFEAGRDVGLGMFGQRGSSTLSAGVRIAQFVSKSNVAIDAVPDLQWKIHHINRYQSYFPSVYLHNYRSSFHVFSESGSSERNFHGIGPTISWDASAPIIGQANSMELTFDWGANAALLFGRQTAQGHHHESGHFKATSYNYTAHSFNSQYYSHTAPFSRQKSVTVPNVGGFAGVSFKFPNAKVSFGYRGDFFFGAMDAGTDTRKAETVGFYGPFATISVGIGG